jgi:tetratricopeptide (TPR) repeat protein
MLNDKIYSGYRLLEARKCIETCILWCAAWNDIMYIMDHNEISGISAFDDEFQGIQSVFNWASDFEMELRNAGQQNENFLQTRIDFCNEYIKRSEDKQQLNIENMKSSIAEAYIEIGRPKEGDALFESYLAKDPKWGWGWIAWSDCYWIFSGNKQNDYQKAEAIFKRALIVEGLRDREDVMVRLLNFYGDTDREEEAAELEKELNKLEKNKHDLKNTVEQISIVKVGRNDPCPCGSGKKYKKCCGKA